MAFSWLQSNEESGILNVTLHISVVGVGEWAGECIRGGN